MLVPVFDPDYLRQVADRYPDRSDWEASDVASVALSPERDKLRDWIEREVAHLPEPGRGRLTARLRSEKHLVSGLNELGAAAVLRDAGLRALYEPELNGRTPDLFVPAEGNRRPIVVEVWTREPPREAAGQRRAWHDLRSRIAKIPVPVGLRVETPGGDSYRPPSSGEAKKLTAAVKEWLLAGWPMPGDRHNVDGYRFYVWGQAVGLRTVLTIPGRTSTLDSSVVIRAVKDKVTKYAAITDQLGGHLLVVLAAHPSAPLDIDLVRTALDGRQRLTVRFSPDARGTIADWKTRLRTEEVAERFDPALSTVGWLRLNLGDPDLTLLPVHSAARPLPILVSDRVVQ
jgi:hypothetical protein